MSPTGLKIAISGAGGFLGATAVSYFVKSPRVAEVRALFSPRGPVPAGDARLQVFQGDLADRRSCGEWLGRADVVLHLANRGFPSDAFDRPLQTVAENLEITRVLLETMAERGVRRLVYAGSGGAVYRERPGAPAPFAEDAPTEARSVYALYKLLSEQLILFSENALGIRSYLLRIANPYGPGQFGRSRQGFIGVALQKLMRNEPLPVWGDLSTVKDFLHVDDLMRAFELFAHAPSCPGGIYNIGSGKPASLRDVVDVIESVTGRRLQLQPMARKPTDATWTVLDTKKVRDALGWDCAVGLRHGLQMTWTAVQEAQRQSQAA